MDLIPLKAVRRLRDIIDIFHETSVEILETKKEALRKGDQALASQIGQGKDVISILCAISFFTFHYIPLIRQRYSVRENMKASEEDRLSESELLGQVT